MSKTSIYNFITLLTYIANDWVLGFFYYHIHNYLRSKSVLEEVAHQMLKAPNNDFARKNSQELLGYLNSKSYYNTQYGNVDSKHYYNTQNNIISHDSNNDYNNTNGSMLHYDDGTTGNAYDSGSESAMDCDLPEWMRQTNRQTNRQTSQQTDDLQSPDVSPTRETAHQQQQQRGQRTTQQRQRSKSGHRCGSAESRTTHKGERACWSLSPPRFPFTK